MKILEPTASQKSQISGFWLQKSQSGNPAAGTRQNFPKPHHAQRGRGAVDISSSHNTHYRVSASC